MEIYIISIISILSIILELCLALCLIDMFWPYTPYISTFTHAVSSLFLLLAPGETSSAMLLQILLYLTLPPLLLSAIVTAIMTVRLNVIGSLISQAKGLVPQTTVGSEPLPEKSADVDADETDADDHTHESQLGDDPVIDDSDTSEGDVGDIGFS